ncbi:MAG: GTP cyclohydrolase FolE2 [Roseibacillus sp.]|jgi:GTP cyclohydrolase I|nr:GTP cyclohydrolase I FolE2 [Roseibacillus sp.]MCP4731028.1 GTP cyclohydrolase I FolE2 [Roseibacillus sp.]MDP7307629.1 GTP cyclohydrolase FolE2 [Roseibacillus sp.]MDP7496072.1 GTP cyclohydrolase FolE2 [Roseibacillus sp.]|tara:strand:- start:34924 stop:35712 length:789 start_codon:yes stop_codon:yes gene_type:complete
MHELTDMQNERDDRNLPIDRVGVKSLRFPVEVREKSGEVQRTVATVALAVDLPHHYKGTHMSRFVEILNSHGNCLDVRSMASLPQELLERLDARRAHVSFQFPFFRSKPAPVTKKEGLLDYEVRFEVEAEKEGGVDFVLTVMVPVTTLCPCSKAISRRGAHNQRGMVTFAIRFSEPVWIEDAVDLVERSASSELYSLLKRPDEKEVTERAYDHPVFVEDLVRNVALRSEAHGMITWYRIEAENFESIHNHNAYAIIEKRENP